VKSLTLMAVLWSLATLLCGVARNYEEMLVGRVLVGVGEAAYGSVGIAVVISVFPSRLRATLSAAFMAGGLAGQVLGVGLGGVIAASHGWRVAFIAIALGGLALGLLYPLLVGERRMAAAAAASGAPMRAETGTSRPRLSTLFASRSVLCTYLGSGLQLYVAGAIPAWLPTYFHRYYALPIDRAASLAAMLLFVMGVGMVVCGMVSDRLARSRPDRKFGLAIAYCLACAVLLFFAFSLPPGAAQLVVLGTAVFLAAGTTGPAGAAVANLTPLAIHGTAFATLTLANNLLGLAPGPIVTGHLADQIGLLNALYLLPVASLAAAAVLMLARTSYRGDLAAVAAT
jgi:predicted MFS family arabinose efflux permease